MRSEFNIGQKVKLSSGGPLMTIDHVEDEVVGCVWFEGTRLRTANFRPGTLSRSSDIDHEDDMERVDNFG